MPSLRVVYHLATLCEKPLNDVHHLNVSFDFPPALKAQLGNERGAPLICMQDPKYLLPEKLKRCGRDTGQRMERDAALLP